jgi:hypothetical protein
MPQPNYSIFSGTRQLQTLQPLPDDLSKVAFPLSEARKGALVFLLQIGFWIDCHGWLWRLDLEGLDCVRVIQLSRTAITALWRDGAIAWSLMGDAAVHVSRVK